MCLSHQLSFEPLDSQAGEPESVGAHIADYFPSSIISSSSSITGKVPYSLPSWGTLLFFAKLDTWPTPGDAICHSPLTFIFSNSTGSQEQSGVLPGLHLLLM